MKKTIYLSPSIRVETVTEDIITNSGIEPYEKDQTWDGLSLSLGK